MRGFGLVEQQSENQIRGNAATLTGSFVSWKVKEILDGCRPQIEKIKQLSFREQVSAINALRVLIHNQSPFYDEPVDCVQWVSVENITANDYNPNTVAPPEMKLLERSILEDGYTQPIVAWSNGENFEVIDGFHRNRVGKECSEIRSRIKGYLPITIANEHRLDRGDRIASTIRHNRARGKHQVEAMSDIVVELKRRNWTEERICRELGMEQDEVLRLCQITGLSELFSDQEFSKSWDVEGAVTEADFQELTDDISTYGEESASFRTVNTGDENRIFHTYEKWECYRAGFYSNSKEGMSKEQCEEAYRDFLSDIPKFVVALEHVITEWKFSCEHYLTNCAMNRIAWLGQASACYAIRIPSAFRSGYWLLTEEEQRRADDTALIYLNKWLSANGRPSVSMAEARGGEERQMEIY